MLQFMAAMAMVAQPSEPETATPKNPVESCSPSDPSAAADTDEIVICVERPDDGYRIDPDMLEAERLTKRRKLKRPERFADTTCNSVGPMGCTGGGFDILGAALAAGMMAYRAAEGENVGKMFVTEPQPDKYQLYLEVKRKREAEEAAAKAKAGEVPAE